MVPLKLLGLFVVAWSLTCGLALLFFHLLGKGLGA